MKTRDPFVSLPRVLGSLRAFRIITIGHGLRPGPADCSGPINSLGSASNMLKQLQDIRIVRCDEAAWRFLGISLAGYDVLVSLFLAAVAAWGAEASLARQKRSG